MKVNDDTLRVGIMRMVASGSTSQEIASKLNISNYKVMQLEPKANMNNR